MQAASRTVQSTRHQRAVGSADGAGAGLRARLGLPSRAAEDLHPSETAADWPDSDAVAGLAVIFGRSSR